MAYGSKSSRLAAIFAAVVISILLFAPAPALSQNAVDRLCPPTLPRIYLAICRGVVATSARLWCTANFNGARRTQCISQSAQGNGPFFACGPGGTRVGLCGGAGGVCCGSNQRCTYNSCVALPNTPTPTPTPTSTSTPTATVPPNDCTGKPDGTTCDAGFNWGTTLLCEDGECVACATNDTATPRFVDNGNGTITDRQTCLVWEKKDDAGGIHDKDNEYTWSNRANEQGACTVSGCPPNGEVFTVFLATLNSTGFAGHGDWRLPTSGGSSMYPTGQAAQLESLILGAYPDCGDTTVDPVVPCTDPLFNVNCGGIHPPGASTVGNPGCTIDGAGGAEECSCLANYYAWSFTDSGAAVVEPTAGAWSLWQTLGGTTASFKKSFPHLARAMRGGVVFVP